MEAATDSQQSSLTRFGRTRKPTFKVRQAVKEGSESAPKKKPTKKKPLGPPPQPAPLLRISVPQGTEENSNPQPEQDLETPAPPNQRERSSSPARSPLREFCQNEYDEERRRSHHMSQPGPSSGGWHPDHWREQDDTPRARAHYSKTPAPPNQRERSSSPARSPLREFCRNEYGEERRRNHHMSQPGPSSGGWHPDHWREQDDTPRARTHYSTTHADYNGQFGRRYSHERISRSAENVPQSSEFTGWTQSRHEHGQYDEFPRARRDLFDDYHSNWDPQYHQRPRHAPHTDYQPMRPAGERFSRPHSYHPELGDERGRSQSSDRLKENTEWLQKVHQKLEEVAQPLSDPLSPENRKLKDLLPIKTEAEYFALEKELAQSEQMKNVLIHCIHSLGGFSAGSSVRTALGFVFSNRMASQITYYGTATKIKYFETKVQECIERGLCMKPVQSGRFKMNKVSLTQAEIKGHSLTWFHDARKRKGASNNCKKQAKQTKRCKKVRQLGDGLKPQNNDMSDIDEPSTEVHSEAGDDHHQSPAESPDQVRRQARWRRIVYLSDDDDDDDTPDVRNSSPTRHEVEERTNSSEDDGIEVLQGSFEGARAQLKASEHGPQPTQGCKVADKANEQIPEITNTKD